MDIVYKQCLQDTIQSLIHPLIGTQSANITLCKEADQWRVNIEVPRNVSSLLVGEGGEIIHSLQHLTRVLVHKKFPQDRTHFILDVNFYRRDREANLKEKILKLAQDDVLDNGHTLILVGLTSYERKIVHGLFVDIDDLETVSVGQGLNRKLIIRPTSETGSKGMENAKVIHLFSHVSDLVEKM